MSCRTIQAEESGTLTGQLSQAHKATRGAAPPDGGCEVGVERRGQAVMEVLGRRAVPRAKVGRLRHAARRQDAHQLVEIGIVRALRQIQGFCQSLQTQTLVSNRLLLSQQGTCDSQELQAAQDVQLQQCRWSIQPEACGHHILITRTRSTG